MLLLMICNIWILICNVTSFEHLGKGMLFIWVITDVTC